MESGVKEPIELTTEKPVTPPIVTSDMNAVKSNSTDVHNKHIDEVSMTDKLENIKLDDDTHKDISMNATNIPEKLAKSEETIIQNSTASVDIKTVDSGPEITTYINEEKGVILETKPPDIKVVDITATTALVEPEILTTVNTITALETTAKLDVKPSHTIQVSVQEQSKTEVTTVVDTTMPAVMEITTTQFITTSTVEPMTTTPIVEATSTLLTVHLTTAPTTIGPTTTTSTIEPTKTTIESSTFPSTTEPTSTAKVRTTQTTIEPTSTTSEPTKPTTIKPTTPEVTQPVTDKPNPKTEKPTTTSAVAPSTIKQTSTSPTYIETTQHTTTAPPFNLGRAIGDGFKNKDPLVIGITAGVGAVVLIILILVIVCICRCRRRRQRQPKMRHTNRHDIARGSIDDIFRDKGYTRLAHNEHNTSGNHPKPIEMSPLLRNRSVMNRNVMNRDVLNTTGKTFLGNDDTVNGELHNHSGDDPTSPLTTPNDINSASDVSPKTEILDPNLYEVDLSTEDLNLETADRVPTENGNIDDNPFVVVNENNPFNANNNKPKSYIRDSNPTGDEESNPFDNAPRPNPFRTSRTIRDYQYE